MKFFFCEKCGKRVTEVDLDRGAAKDKKLKGVFCTECAVGVLTMEMQPLTKSDAHQLLHSSAPSTKPASVEPSNARPARRHAAHSETSIKAAPRNVGKVATPSPDRKLLMILSVGTGLVLLGAVLWFGSSRSEQRKGESVVPLPAPHPSAASTPITKPTPPAQLATDIPAVAAPASVEVQPASTSEEVSLERRAQGAFDELTKFEGLAPQEKEARLERVQKFLREYGSTIVAARAIILEQQLKTPSPTVAVPTTVPTPPPDSSTVPQAAGIPPNVADGLIGYWSLNDGKGSTAADSSGGGRHGTLVNAPTWVEGKFGQALKFNGKDNYVVIDNLPINKEAGGKNTVAFWMNWESGNYMMPLGWDVGAPGQFYCLMLNGGLFGFNTSGSDLLGIASNGLANRWAHVVAVFPNGSLGLENAKLYINGIAQALTQCAGIPKQGLVPSGRIFLSGGDASANHKFMGILDDVRIYNRELSAEEARMLAGSGGAEAAAVAPPTAPATLSDSLVLNWDFDEGKGTSIADKSGAGNAGILGKGAAWTASGKINGALNLSGNNGNIEVTNLKGLGNGNQPHTMAAWIKVESLPVNRAWILVLGRPGEFAHHWLLNTNGSLQLGAWGDGDRQLQIPVQTGSWKHLAVSFDGATLKGYLDGVFAGSSPAAFELQGVPFHIARRQDGQEFKGQLDELRIYSRALSADEIRALVVHKAPSVSASALPSNGLVAYWNFNENQGNGVIDASGNENTGSLKGNFEWVAAGKLGGALKLETNGFVLLPERAALNITTDITLAAWFKTSSKERSVVVGGYGEYPYHGYSLALNSPDPGKISYWSGARGEWASSSSSGYNDGAWHHVSVTVSGNLATFYKDGQPDGNKASARPDSYAGIRSLGAGSDSHHPLTGLLDEVRIYNRALSSAEIAALAGAGAPANPASKVVIRPK